MSNRELRVEKSKAIENREKSSSRAKENRGKRSSRAIENRE